VGQHQQEQQQQQLLMLQHQQLIRQQEQLKQQQDQQKQLHDQDSGEDSMKHALLRQMQQQQQQQQRGISSSSDAHTTASMVGIGRMGASFGQGQDGDSGLVDVSGMGYASDEGGKSSKGGENMWGLMGLMDVIRTTDRDLNQLTVGSDLTTCGLNLNSTDRLYTTFSSPFSGQPTAEPQFTIPQCYLLPPPTLKPEHITKLAIETLFYMFYGMPRDVLQLRSAQELYRREWKYHRDLRIWLKPRSPQEIAASSPTDGSVATSFNFFDMNSWESRPFNSAFRGDFATGLLTEDDLKAAPSGGA